MGLRTCAAHAVSDNALSAAGLRIEQSTLHRRMRFSVLERLDALPMVDLCRVTRTTQQRSAARQRAGRRRGDRSTWRDRSQRRCLLLRRLKQLRIAGHRSDHLHEHCISFVVAPTVGDALIICRSHNVVVQSARVYRETQRGRSGLVDATHRGGSVRTYLQDAMTVPASLAGLPSIAVPRGKDSKELPVGLQVIGAVDYQGAGGCGSALLRCARVLGRV